MGKTENREIHINCTLSAPVALVWEAWTNPEQIVNWWGPAGFTNTIHTMDFREGGEWNLTMHGPDGTNFPNRSIYKEIIPQKKIVFEHQNPHFFATILFEPNGETTQMDWTLLLDTPEMRDIVVKAHKADEGQKQNVEKLEKYLSMVQSETKIK